MSMWHVPAVVLIVLTWLSTPATTLADVARREAVRRDLLAAPAHVYTNQDLPAQDAAPPASAPPPAAAAGDATPPEKPAETAAPAPPDDAKHDEAWWRNRITTARDALTNDQVLADALQSRINALTSDWINRDDPAQKAQLFEQRQQALAALDSQNKKIIVDRQAIQDVLDDARKHDVPAGWIR